ncbi:hypothetical protein HAX54_005688 [Datura stramonium]|uniref:Uncharacterized protein n=1 Tax=Datura stramonium TaxID=4076 RepID=A0ABS8T983_DATST|nr:hypothetical protein [Datura stramonium]
MHETTEFGIGLGQCRERNIFDKLWEILVMTMVVKAMQIKIVLVDFVLADDGTGEAMGSSDGGYPHDFKLKKRGGLENGVVYNMFGDYKSDKDSQRVEGLNAECKIGHGHSTIVPIRGYVPANVSQNAIG